MKEETHHEKNEVRIFFFPFLREASKIQDVFVCRVFLEHQFDVSASDHSTVNGGGGFKNQVCLGKSHSLPSLICVTNLLTDISEKLKGWSHWVPFLSY